jgi:periplasmic copper chaperone A
MIRIALLSAAGALALSSAALAHVALEQKEAPIGASYKAVLRVPHGCDGSATQALRVRIPDGYLNVKPMPKPRRPVTGVVTFRCPTTGRIFRRVFT